MSILMENNRNGVELLASAFKFRPRFSSIVNTPNGQDLCSSAKQYNYGILYLFSGFSLLKQPLGECVVSLNLCNICPSNPEDGCLSTDSFFVEELKHIARVAQVVRI